MSENYCKNIKEMSLILLVFFASLVLFLIFPFKVRALYENRTFNVPTSFTSFYDYDFRTKLNELEDFLKSTGYYYAITMYFSKSEPFRYSSIRDVIIFKTKPTKNAMYGTGGDVEIVVDINQVYSITLNLNSSSKVIQQNSTSYVKLDEENLTSFVSQVKTFDFENAKWSNDRRYLYSNGSSKYVVYSANFDISNNRNYDYQFNDRTVEPNGLFIQTKYINSKHTENLNLSTKDLYRVEYTFDFTNDINENNMFSHEFNFSTSWTYEFATFDKYSYPYLQYKKDDKYYKLPLDKKSEGIDSLIYADTQINSFQDIQELKFIVPLDKMSSFDNSSIFIHFDSSLNFTRTIYNNTQQGDIVGPGNDDRVENSDNIDKIKDTLTDDSIDTDGANSFFGDFNDVDHGGISGIITSPLTAIGKITNKCTPLKFTIYEQEITLPCGDTLFWEKKEVESFRIIWNIIVGGPIIYLLLLKLYHVINNLKNPDDSRVEVMKL